MIAFKRYYGLETDQAVLDQHVKDLSVKLEVYDQILSKQRYLAGDVRTCIFSSDNNLTVLFK
jgi:glutathione S-transferase